ncbi:MAG: EamA family transporter [Acidobacteriota bacterium]|jgi:drug/metabolite transporter (DMT)-like permease
MIKIVILSTFTTLLITSGQVLWKLGLNRIGGFYLSEYGLFGNLFRILTNPFVIAGFVVYIIATGFFMFLLSKFDISLVIPISSVSFVFSLIAGAYIFHEQISLTRVTGVFVIITGILMVLKN